MTEAEAPERIWIDDHGGNWSPVGDGTQRHQFVRGDIHAAAVRRAEKAEAALAEARAEGLREAAEIARDMTPDKHTYVLASHVTGRAIEIAILTRIKGDA